MQTTHREVVVIGAGAVGLTAARRLTAAGMDVVLVEAGRDHADSRDRLMADLSWDEQHHDGAMNGWTTGLGGTTQLWGGQLWAWENYEFRPRDHVASTLWPVDREGLQPHYEQFLDYVHASPALRRYSLESPIANGMASDARSYYTKYSAWLPWRNRNLFRAMRRQLRASGRLTVLSHHVATRVDVSNAQQPAVWLSDQAGNSSRLSCRLLVLGAGTLGNVRLLQLSDASSSPWLGRGFMDHVSARFATVVVEDPVRFVRTSGARYEGRTLVTPRQVMQPSFAQRNSLTNAYAHWRMELPETSSYSILRELLRGMQRGSLGTSASDLGRLLQHGPRDLMFGAYCVAILRRRPVPPEAKLHLYIDVEQPPRQQSSISWTRDRDRDSLRINWTTGPEEDACFTTFGRSLLEGLDLEAMGLRLATEVGAPEWKDTIHMMGGARIGEHVDESVVDADSVLHGAPNVLVLGASTFPTGGVANPTMTAGALSLRAIETALERL